MSGLHQAIPASGPSLRRDAERRLQHCLEEFGVEPGACREALVQRLLERADGARSAGEVLDQAEAELAAWFASVLGEDVVAGNSPLLIGRAAYRVSGAARRWPEALLARDLPEGFAEALRVAVPTATPAEEPGTMVEQSFESWSLRGLAPVRLTRLLMVSGGRQAVAS